MVFTKVIARVKFDPSAHVIYSSGFTFKIRCDIYLCAASGTTVSRVSYIVGPVSDHAVTYFSYWSVTWFTVFVNEFGHIAGGVGPCCWVLSKKRTNVIPIIEDARHPARYRMLVGMVDIFSDVAQPDQVYSHLTLISFIGFLLSVLLMSIDWRLSLW